MARDIQGIGLSWLNRFAGSQLVQRMKLNKPAEKVLYQASKTGFKTAGAANRAFRSVQGLVKPARLEKSTPPGLFDLTPTDEQAMIQDTMQRFAEERLRPAAYDADNNCRAPEELLQEANDLGLTMMAVPEDIGGAAAEQSVVGGVLQASALAQGDMGLALACIAPLSVANALTRWGTAEQQSTYLTAFLEEKPPAAAVAIQEARPLFDPFMLKTTAQKVDGNYVLNGTKSMVPLADSAELFLVAATVGEGEGQEQALFIVESSSKGLRIEAEPSMGIRAASPGRLILKDVSVPQSAMLGGEEGVDYPQLIALSRLGWCALAIGTSQAVLDYVVPYANERKAFGEPISHRQAVAFMIANIGVELEGMRLLTWRAASRADQGKSFIREAGLARRFTAEKSVAIGNDGVQVLGGHGFVKEHPVERWYRDLRAVGVMEGSVLL